jgi:hypothetical protein
VPVEGLRSRDGRHLGSGIAGADGGQRRPAGWLASSDLDLPPVAEAGPRAGIGSDGSPGNGGDPDQLSSGRGVELELGRMCWAALGPVVCARIELQATRPVSSSGPYPYA